MPRYSVYYRTALEYEGQETVEASTPQLAAELASRKHGSGRYWVELGGGLAGLVSGDIVIRHEPAREGERPAMTSVWVRGANGETQVTAHLGEGTDGLGEVVVVELEPPLGAVVQMGRVLSMGSSQALKDLAKRAADELLGDNEPDDEAGPTSAETQGGE